MNLLRLELYSTKQLQDMVDTHDCKLSPEDGCDCELVRNEIHKRESNKTFDDFMNGWTIRKV